MNAKYVYGQNHLIAYLDLCGTKFAYSELELGQQIERISLILRRVLECLDNAFEKKSSLYVHMYADSLVLADKENLIENITDKFLKLMLEIQYGILIDSETLSHRAESENQIVEPPFMPVLSRAIIKRGEYYGIITDEFHNDLGSIFSNFSLVGGSSIVGMDRDLKGLPMGTYIDKSLISELNIGKERFIDVEGDQLKFVKQSQDFDSLRGMFSTDIKNRSEDIDAWCRRLIESTKNNDCFKNKIIPWCDVMQGRRYFIARTEEAFELPAKGSENGGSTRLLP